MVPAPESKVTATGAPRRGAFTLRGASCLAQGVRPASWPLTPTPLSAQCQRVKTFHLMRPAGRAAPVLVSVPHAGLAVPPEVAGELLADEATLRADADLCVDALYADAPTQGASLLTAVVSRFVVDLNRATTDVDSASVPDHPSPLADARRGLIWRLSTGGKRVLARPLTMERLRNRITRYHAPYHDALWRTLTELRDRHGHAILLDGHSMPAFSGGEIGQGRRHADIVPGCLGGTSCAPALLQAACEYFTSRGYTVAVDDPYRGGFITRHYGRPREGLHALQLEVNRDLYLDPFTLDHRVRGFARLQTDLLGFVRHLTGLRL